MKIKLKGYNSAGSSARHIQPPYRDQQSPTEKGHVASAKIEPEDDSLLSAELSRHGDVLEELDADSAGSPSTSSSRADEEFLNAPLPPADSSGDEYTAPGTFAARESRGRRRHFESVSPRPRREGGRQARASRGTESVEPHGSELDEPSVFVSATSRKAPPRQIAESSKKRGRAGKVKEKDPSFSVRLFNYDRNTKGKARASEDVEGDESRLGTPGEEGIDLDDDEYGDDGNHAHASGSTTPGESRVLYGADGRKRGGAVSTVRNKAVKGHLYGMENDELQLPIDPEGEKKVDESGHLCDGAYISIELNIE